MGKGVQLSIVTRGLRLRADFASYRSLASWGADTAENDRGRSQGVPRQAGGGLGRSDPALFPHLAQRRGQEPRRELRSGDRRRPLPPAANARADPAAEQAMRALIREHFPSHGIVGEEFGAERPDADYVWFLDPIDGTKSFISGMPAWGTLIALTHRGTPVLGMMHQPFVREWFS